MPILMASVQLAPPPAACRSADIPPSLAVVTGRGFRPIHRARGGSSTPGRLIRARAIKNVAGSARRILGIEHRGEQAAGAELFEPRANQHACGRVAIAGELARMSVNLFRWDHRSRRILTVKFTASITFIDNCCIPNQTQFE
jgi:hypothetical protein